MLFKPSKGLTNVPELENKVIQFLTEQLQANSIELSEHLKLSLTDTFFVIEKLSKVRRIEFTADGKHWQLTAEERKRLRRKNAINS